MENIYLKNALEYCKEEELYLGEGTQTAKILFIGKEAGWNEKMGAPSGKEKIEEQSRISTRHNIECWQEHNGGLDRLKEDALKCWPKSPTWNNYQRIVEGIIGKKIAKYDFLDYSFITELSQIPYPTAIT